MYILALFSAFEVKSYNINAVHIFVILIYFYVYLFSYLLQNTYTIPPQVYTIYNRV